MKSKVEPVTRVLKGQRNAFSFSPFHPFPTNLPTQTPKLGAQHHKRSTRIASQDQQRVASVHHHQNPKYRHKKILLVNRKHQGAQS